jgi:hypothetical protein
MITNMTISGFIRTDLFDGYVYGDVNGKPFDLIKPGTYKCKIEPNSYFDLLFDFNKVYLSTIGELVTNDFKSYGGRLRVAYLSDNGIIGFLDESLFVGSSIFDYSESVIADQITINGSRLDTSKYYVTSQRSNIAELTDAMAVPVSMLQGLSVSSSESLTWIKKVSGSVDFYDVYDNTKSFMFTIFKLRNNVHDISS